MINGWIAYNQACLNKVYINSVKCIKLIIFRNKDAILIFAINVVNKLLKFSIQNMINFKLKHAIMNVKKISKSYDIHRLYWLYPL